MDPALRHALDDGIFWITDRLAIGRFPTPERAEALARAGVTHILNVGEAPSLALHRERFQVTEVAILDLEPIPEAQAAACVDAIHAALAEPTSRIYVHCIAGRNRSPSIAWLYLIACGIDPEVAAQMITSRCPDAVPGHVQLVSEGLVRFIVEYGRSHNMTVKVPGDAS